MSKRNPILGITLGDINGVGPEIALSAAIEQSSPTARLALIGNANLIQALAKEKSRPPIPVWEPPAPFPRGSNLVSVHLPHSPISLVRRPGQISVAAARAAHHWIVTAAHWAKQGILDALVTAPIQKEGFMRAGLNVPGHTELLAQCAGVKHVEMMLLNDEFRVVLCTRHIPIRDVSRHLTRARVREALSYTADALQWLGLRSQRIAICGLNPHAGDGGAIGDEERRIISPVLRAFRHPRVRIAGPIPADTVFYQVRQGEFDAVLAMYHDQGLAPFKMVAFENGVNLTLGLPFVRTSPDHGTAYDLAGTGQANPSSMQAAIQLAARLARRPNPWHPK